MFGNLWRKLSGSFSIPRRLHSSRGSPPKGKRSRPARFRPAVEALDDRTLPSGFSLESAAFGEGMPIPRDFTRVPGGSNQSPSLEWKDPPAGTMSFALLMDDPTVRGENGKFETFNHWVVFDLKASTLKLRARQPRVEVLDNGALQGTNGNGVIDLAEGKPVSAEGIGYLGPRPPRGEEHTYLFRVFALNTPQLTQGPGSQTPLAAGATKQELQIAMLDHVLGVASLRGVVTGGVVRF